MAENSDGLYFKVGVDTSGLESLEDKARATFEKVVKEAEASGEDMDKALSKAAISMYNEFSEMGDALNSARWKEAKEGLKAMFSFNGDEVRASAERLQALNDEQEAIERVQNAIEGYLDERAKGNSNASILGVSANKEITEAEQTLRKLTVVIGGVETEYDSLKQAISSLRNEMGVLANQGQEDTEMYREMQKEMTRLQQIQNGIINDLKTGATASRDLQAYLDIASTATAATGLWQSAMVGLGASTESAQEAITKLQAVQTALNSVMTVQKQLMDRSSGTYAAYQKVLAMLGISKKKDASATNAQTAAQNANSVAMKGAKVAAIGLRGAMMAIGIGLITSAVAFLIDKWDDLVAGFKDFVGLSGDTNGAFDKISAVMQGIGSAVVNYVLTPLKTMVTVVRNLMQGEFKKAFTEGLETAKQGLNVMSNFTESYNKKMEKLAEEHVRERAKIAEKNAQIDIDANEAKYGNDWKFTQEGNAKYKEMLDNRIKMYKQDTDEYREAVNDKMRYDREYAKHHEEETKRLKAEYAKQAKARKDALATYTKELEEVEYNAEMAVQQARIDAMEDGMEKSLAQLEHDNNKWLHAHEKAIKDRAEKIKAFELSQGKKEQSPEYYTEQARTQLKASGAEKLQSAKEVKQQQEVLDKMLADYQTYQEARLKLADEYGKKNQDLVLASNIKGDSADVMNARLAELDKQMQEAQSKLDLDFANKSEEFVAWAESLGQMGMAQIQEEMAKVQAELANIPINERTAEQRAKIISIQNEIKRLEKEWGSYEKAMDGDAKSTKLNSMEKQLKSTTKALDVAFDGLEAFSDEWSDTAKQALRSSKQIYDAVKNLIGNIIEIGRASLEATKTASIETAEAIKQAERSSVILAIIQAALEVAQAMFNLFKKESKITDVVISQHQDEMQAIDDLIAKNEELIEERKKYGGSIKELYEENKKYLQLEAQKSQTFFKELLDDNKTGQHSVSYMLQNDRDRYDVTLAKHEKELKSVFGDAQLKLLESSRNLGKDLYEAVTKLTDKQFKQLEGTTWWAQIKNGYNGDKIVEELLGGRDIVQQLAEIGDKEKDALRGFSRQDLQDDLLSYLEDVNASIEDIDESFDKMIKNVIKRNVMNKYLQTGIDSFLGDMDKVMRDELIDASDKDLIAQAGEKLREVAKLGQEKVKEIYDALNIDLEADKDSATARGIATASQESVDENNARLTAIQGYTFQIGEGVRTMANNSSLILNNVILIQRATDTIRDDIKNIQTYGVKIQS